MNWDGDWHMGWMGFWWILTIAVVVAAVWVVVVSTRRGGQETPKQVVKRRYANGEIDRDTYQRMLEDLGT